jgi:tRNA A-37 threonylcarbamoyl transferase component Bud32
MHLKRETSLAPASQQYKFLPRWIDVGTGRLPAHSTLQQGRYLLIAKIGKGGMGAVYLAHDTQMGNRQVAIKEMSQTHLKDAGELQRARERFQREADMLHALSHMHLPQVYNSFQEQNRSYLVMEYIKGEPLFDLLKQAHGAALGVENVIAYGIQLAEVLAYLHDRYPPIVFHDLKPSNVMVQANGQICLIDFGIARFFQKDKHSSSPEVFVSPGYSPPEQYGDRATPQSDLFSLGATLHHCLTGQSPSTHIKEHLFDFPPIELLNPQVPPDLNVLVQTMLATEPSQRPASAHDIVQELQRIQIVARNPVRLPQDAVFDPDAFTTGIGGSTPPAFPSRSNRQARPASWLVGAGAVGLAVFQELASGLLGSSMQALGNWKHHSGRHAGEALSNFWQEQVSQVVALCQNARVWERQFTLFFLAILALMLSGSFYLLKTTPDATHVLGLTLLVFLLCLSGFFLSRKYLTDPVSRSLLGLIGVALLLAGSALQALPDLEPVIHATLQSTTLNQLAVFTFLALSLLCVLRPESRLAWTSKVLLGLLALCGALLQYSFGVQILQQFPTPSGVSLEELNTAIVWVLVVLALLSLFRTAQPFKSWSRFCLLLIAAALTLFQYAFGFQELQHFLISGQPSIDDIQYLIILSFLCTWIPVSSALLAFCFPRLWTTRLALGTVGLMGALMLSYRGQQISFLFFPAIRNPLEIKVLAASTFYQLTGPLLAVVTSLALFRLPGKRFFSVLDHGLLLLGTLICTRLDDAYWQAQAAPLAIQMDQTALNQQFIKLAGLAPVGAMYIALALLALALFVRAVCYLWGQSRVSQRLNAWSKGLSVFIIRMERVLALTLVSSTLVLQGSIGTLKLVILYGVNWLVVGNQPDYFDLSLLLLMSILVLAGIVLIFRLFASKSHELGRSERLALFLSGLLCLLLISQKPLFANLPLLNQHVQITGNLFHLPVGILNLLLLAGLVLASILACLWIRRSFFVRYQELLRLALLLIITCAFLQVFWPIFLPLGLLVFIPVLLLTIQIEHTG